MWKAVEIIHLTELLRIQPKHAGYIDIKLKETVCN